LKATVTEKPGTRFAGADVLAGSLSAVVTLSYASCFATLIFGGPLAGSTSLGVLAALVSSGVALLVLSWRSSFHFTMGGADSNPSAILAVSVAVISAELARENPAEVLPTVLMFLYLSALGCGLLLYLIGGRRWGRFVRFIPHPVVGGFLVGTAYLLLAGGWKMLVGVSPIATTLELVARVPAFAWVFAAGVAVALLILMRRWRHFLVIPGVIVVAGVIFHLALWWAGIDHATARAHGLLLRPVHLGTWGNPFNQPWDLVRWDLIFRHGVDFIVMTIVVTVTVLLNATSLDHAVGQDADFDREVKALGIANVFAGLAGGLVAVNSFNRSLLNLRAGAQSRWSARVCALVLALLVAGVPQVVGWLPQPVLVGLVIYLGISLLLQWLWDARREMLTSDYLIMLGILATVMLFGIVAGVMVGTLASMMSFVLTLIRSGVIKEQFTCATRHSNVERPAPDIEWLKQHGDQAQGAVLHGYLFFGTSSTILDELRGPLQKARILMLDFWHVSGIDVSSAVVLRKLLKLAADADVEVVFTGLSAKLQSRLAGCGLDLARTRVHVFADLDHGLEWTEETLLSEVRKNVSLEEFFTGLDPAEVAKVGDYFEFVAVPARETFIRSGDPADRFYFLLSGRVSIHLQAAATGYRMRLRSYGAGTIVGEMGLYSDEPRSADISADIDSRLASISRARLKEMEDNHPRLASRLHHLVVLTLATRLRTANSAIKELL
jgi:SulP family sulfate permease